MSMNQVAFFCLFKKGRLPIYFSKWPSGTSYKSFSHILQLIAAEKFQNFDYGSEENLSIYDSPVPEVYNLSAIEVPTAIFISKEDPLVNYEVDALYTFAVVK